MVEPVVPQDEAGREAAPQSWSHERPVVLGLIAVGCLFMAGGPLLHGPAVLSELVTGQRSLLAVLDSFAWAAALGAGGILSLLRMRAAVYLFALLMPWQLVDIMLHNMPESELLTLLPIAAVWLYCLKLRKQGVLR